MAATSSLARRNSTSPTPRSEAQLWPRIPFDPQRLLTFAFHARCPGIHTVTSERIFNGIPLGSSIEASHGHLYLFQWVFGKDKNLTDLNFGADIDT